MANEKVKKLTKTDRYKQILAYIPTEETDLIDFIGHEIELIAKKNSNGNSKANKQVADNKELVYNALVSVGKPCTISELITLTDLSALANEKKIVTTQRVSAYMSKLKAENKVKSEVIKKITYFSIVED